MTDFNQPENKRLPTPLLPPTINPNPIWQLLLTKLPSGTQPLTIWTPLGPPNATHGQSNSGHCRAPHSDHTPAPHPCYQYLAAHTQFQPEIPSLQPHHLPLPCHIQALHLQKLCSIQSPCFPPMQHIDQGFYAPALTALIHVVFLTNPFTLTTTAPVWVFLVHRRHREITL